MEIKAIDITELLKEITEQVGKAINDINLKKIIGKEFGGTFFVKPSGNIKTIKDVESIVNKLLNTILPSDLKVSTCKIIPNNLGYNKIDNNTPNLIVQPYIKIMKV